MSPSTDARLRRTVLLAGLSALAACAAQSQPVAVRFTPSATAPAADTVVVTLQSATYGEQGVALALTIANTSDADLAVERPGVLLGYRKLEFPVDPHHAAETGSTLMIAAHATADAEFAFVTGAPLHEPATLHLRAVKQGDRWLTVRPVTVPPMPVSDEPTTPAD